MSNKKSNFADNNPENQNSQKVSGKNPRSVQTLHKAQVKPKSQDKEIKIEINENNKRSYKTKTTHLVQKAKMQLKRRVAPGISEIIVRKNEEKRQQKAEQAKKEEQARKEAEQAKKEEELKTKQEKELTDKVEKEMEKQEDKIQQRSATKKEEKVEEIKTEISEKTTEVTEKIKENVNNTVTEVKNQLEEKTAGKSFTQTLREEGQIATEKIAEKVKPVVQETKEKIETKKEETKTQPTETTNDGKSFTQTLREQGLIQTNTQPTPTETPKQEKTETPKETKTESKESSNGEAKTFIDLIRSEGLL